MSLMTSIGQRMTAGLFFGGLALVAGGGAGTGWFVGRMPLQLKLAQQTQTYASEKQHAAEQAASILQAAQARGDALSAGLLNQQAQIDQLKKDKLHAVTQVTTGRACLRGDALRLLDGAPGLRVDGLPPATGGALAADGAIATDTDITGWAIDSGAQYEVCRTRLNALIDWHAPDPALESR